MFILGHRDSEAWLSGQLGWGPERLIWIIHSIHVRTASLRQKRHTISCTHLKCIIWWVLTCAYTWSHHCHDGGNDTSSSLALIPLSCPHPQDCCLLSPYNVMNLMQPWEMAPSRSSAWLQHPPEWSLVCVLLTSKTFCANTQTLVLNVLLITWPLSQ